MGDWLSERSIRILLDLIGTKMCDLDMTDRQDTRYLQVLQQCLREVETLRAATEAPQDVMQRARIGAALDGMVPPEPKKRYGRFAVIDGGHPSVRASALSKSVKR